MKKTVHELKILPEYYDAVRRGDKRFEIRENDRNFHSGDILRLKEWDGEKYTGEELDATVRYVLYGTDEYGLSEGYCILSIDTMMHNIPRVTEEGMDKLMIENAELHQRILQLEKDLAKERAYNYALVTVIRNNNRGD